MKYIIDLYIVTSWAYLGTTAGKSAMIALCWGSLLFANKHHCRYCTRSNLQENRCLRTSPSRREGLAEAAAANTFQRQIADAEW